jgi:catechol 2,3-dioxygenase-like lactoylglutathione lyase family enzyme
MTFGLERLDHVSRGRAHESTGLRHVAFAVGNRLEDHGDADSIYFADPDGNVLELTSYKR